MDIVLTEKDVVAASGRKWTGEGRTECWLWLAGEARARGYGQMWVNALRMNVEGPTGSPTSSRTGIQPGVVRRAAQLPRWGQLLMCQPLALVARDTQADNNRDKDAKGSGQPCDG